MDLGSPGFLSSREEFLSFTVPMVFKTTVVDMMLKGPATPQGNDEDPGHRTGDC